MTKGPVTTQLKTGEIVVDEHLYPRAQWSEDLVKRYANALDAGETLPQIVVGRDGARYVLLDGRHRLKAYQKRFAPQITVIVSPVAPADFFAEGVRLNARHGTPLTAHEVLAATQRLSRQGLSAAAISKVVALSVATVERLLVADVRRLPPASSAESFRRTVGATPSHHVGTRMRRGHPHPLAPTHAEPIAEALTIERALLFLVEQVEGGHHRRVPPTQMEAWAKRARYVTTAFESASRRAEGAA